jgi:hypothetical protein
VVTRGGVDCGDGESSNGQLTMMAGERSWIDPS